LNYILVIQILIVQSVQKVDTKKRSYPDPDLKELKNLTGVKELLNQKFVFSEFEKI
jgi:hypothetical protein